MKRNSIHWVRLLAAMALLVWGTGEAFAGKGGAKKHFVGVVNLNTGTEKQLNLVPGVGPVGAKRIIQYRKEKPFQNVQQLTKVKGFGKKKLAKIKKYLTVSGPNTLKAVAAGGKSKASAK